MKEDRGTVNVEDLSDIKTIRLFLKDCEELALVSSKKTESSDVRKLINELPEYHVLLLHNGTVIISPSMHTNEILRRQKQIYDCAKSFRRDATNLMKKMASTFHLNLQTGEGIYELKFKKSNNQRGSLDEKWNYYFHGAECRFDNELTDQVVEVIIWGTPEFGYLDAFFFYNYMKTTTKYLELAEWFGSDKNVRKAIEVLANKKVLTRDTDVSFSRNILAL